MDRFEDDCTEDPRAILLGATNSWFPVTLSVLAIPQTGSPLAQLIADGWTFFEDVISSAEVAFVVKTLKKTAQLPGIEQFTNEQIWAAIEIHRHGGPTIEQSDLKGPEWDVLTAENPPTDYPHFMSKKVGIPSGFGSATSASHGGSLSINPIATMRRCVPSAALYVWTDRPAPFTEGRVHAKVAVADGTTAFLTSANLTGHALEKNMEAGVVISGGLIPTGLRAHLLALIDTKVISRV